MFSSVLVANRGEIACRIIRTLREMGIRSVAVYSAVDEALPHVGLADEAVRIDGSPPAAAYLDQDQILAAARMTNVDAIHPGYGFLSENARFAQAVAAAGITWIGAPAHAIELMGDKVTARELMAGRGLPVLPGAAVTADEEEALHEQAAAIGFPLMVKAAGGGGGIGMSIVADVTQLAAAVRTARDRAQRSFSDGTVFLERYLPRARHVEVQILAGADGVVTALGERDCSVQRRHQKVLEESPSPAVDDAMRVRLEEVALAAAQAVDYRGAGTVEFLLDLDGKEFYFLEMNTRLQVEHPLTELRTGLDLVAEQLRVAAGDPLSFDPSAPPQPRGHAFEFRVYAEDPERFLPRPGHITTWVEPEGPHVRVDAGYAAGNEVTPWFDPLLAKLCVWAPDRHDALERLTAAAAGFLIEGPVTNLPLLTALAHDDGFRRGEYDTAILQSVRARRPGAAYG